MGKETAKPPESNEGALADIRVVDLTSVRSGPTCTKILADFGAEVLRVERPSDLADDRAFYDQADLHRNKKSILVNLQDKRGVEILRKLAKRADVVVENYRPDVKHRLGIDYETLSPENPRLIYASISGFGQDGPYRGRPGYDQIVQGMSGLMWLTGTEESAPLRIGIPIGDLLAGYYCAMGILSSAPRAAALGPGAVCIYLPPGGPRRQPLFSGGQILEYGGSSSPGRQPSPPIRPHGRIPVQRRFYEYRRRE